jgi:hypothetical protein
VDREFKIRMFVARQLCACSTDPDCCAAPGQGEKEILEISEAIKSNFKGSLEINEIRDVDVLERFPEAAELFKNYGYSALPIIMLGSQIVVYGIPDKEFIVSSLKKAKSK